MAIAPIKLATAQSAAPRPVTIAAKRVTSLANAMHLRRRSLATAAAKLDISRANAPTLVLVLVEVEEV